MTNTYNKVLYIGVTNDIYERVKEHKLKVYPKSFTARYNCDKLVYLEEYEDAKTATTRERQFKKWNRAWKLDLIKDINPNWTDLSQNWNLDLSKTRINQKADRDFRKSGNL